MNKNIEKRMYKYEEKSDGYKKQKVSFPILRYTPVVLTHVPDNLLP